MDPEPQNSDNSDSTFVWDENSQLYFHARFFSLFISTMFEIQFYDLYVSDLICNDIHYMWIMNITTNLC